MSMTIYNTPVVRHIAPILSRFIMFCIGWKATGIDWKETGKLPNVRKCVMIAAPHTSNWDYFYTVLTSFVLKTDISAMGKQSLTEGPFGGIMKWLGIIPIDRSKSNNIVELTIQEFNNNEDLVVVVPPSGTRGKVAYWKTGFYYIAVGAGVPIALGFIDYKNKTGGIGPVIYPTGDLDEDMKKIREFYSTIEGKYPEKQIKD